jgi:hypothetical protein
MKTWKKVGKKCSLPDQEYQAAIAKDILEDNGIKVVVLNQHDSVYKVFGSIKVLVPDGEAELAETLLKELKH